MGMYSGLPHGCRSSQVRDAALPLVSVGFQAYLAQNGGGKVSCPVSFQSELDEKELLTCLVVS